jgi:hypothetical protein
LVQREDGSLQLGVNQTAVDSPVRSAAGQITADAEAAPDNWMFFAVTYHGTQPTGNAQFTFGSPVVDGFRHTFRRTITPTTPQRYYRLASE